MNISWLKIPVFCALLIGLGSGVQAADCKLPANATELAADAGRQMNARRKRAGLKALLVDAKLAAAAMAHACDMSRQGYFSHQGKDGSTHSTRLKNQGCRPRIAAENIAAGHTDAKHLIKRWMASKGHRRNILMQRGVDRYGVGLAHSGKAFSHGFVWVMLFSSDCQR